MGLAERRKIEEMKKSFETDVKKIHEVIGFAVPVDVKWDQFITEQSLHYADEFFQKIFVDSTVAGFKEICADDMGRNAVKESVKKITFQNTTDNAYGDRWCSFANGEVILDHKFQNVDKIQERAKGLVDTLSKAL